MEGHELVSLPLHVVHLVSAERKDVRNMEESRKGKNGELEEDKLRRGENKMII